MLMMRYSLREFSTNTVQLVLLQPRPYGGIGRADADCEPYGSTAPPVSEPY